MSQVSEEHKSNATANLNVAILTISDTRFRQNDSSGDLIEELAREAGHHTIGREIIPDEPRLMTERIEKWVENGQLDAILMTGGTGLSRRDQTFETVSALITKPIPGYGELFRMLSYHQIGAAAMLSRALGGLIGRVALFTMPGSSAAVSLAMKEIILPELPHIMREVRKHEL